MSERVIKFRAKVIAKTPDPTGKYFRAKKGDWMFFALKDLLVESRLGRFPAIDWSTLGQFIGLPDKNGKEELYHKDIIKCSISQTQHYWGVIEWGEAGFVVKTFWFKSDRWAMQGGYELASSQILRFADVTDIEKLGTTYDNPELLKQGGGE